MIKLPNIGYTPRFDVVPKTWKGMDPVERQLAEAEEALVERDDDVGFTKKQLASRIDLAGDVAVVIEPIKSSS